MLSGGYIVTSLLWASALAAMIDRRLVLSAGFLARTFFFVFVVTSVGAAG
jgi:hypothetical protein